jgi:SAM-dependent methyltransferase
MNSQNISKKGFSLNEQWDAAADFINQDAMRPIRYGKCFQYLKHLHSQSCFLEVGCGEGTGLWYAQQLGFNDLTGVEVSEVRLKSARERLGPMPSLRVIGTDCRLPFSDNTFDIIVSAAVIEHTVDPALFMREIARVARPGASIVISSDCWQWRILQILRIFKSVQPIDRAMFTCRLFSIIRQCGLQICHFDGFALPGQEYRFVRMIWNRFTSPASWAWRRMLRMLNVPFKQTHSATDRISELDLFLRVAEQPWSLTGRFKRLCLSVCSDENVFFALKPK